jgi:hypothetical protein
MRLFFESVKKNYSLENVKDKSPILISQFIDFQCFKILNLVS